MTTKEYIEFANALKNNYTIDFDKLPEFCDMAISALSAPTANVISIDQANAMIKSYVSHYEEGKGEWISVSERLPNHDECIKNNRFFNVSDGDRSYSEWFDYDKQMFGEPTMSGFRVDHAVTAWQPLPEPCKAD